LTITTDYVFDGTSPPYTVSAKTNPLQSYGQTKRDGELAALGVEGANVVVLRVPILCVSSRTRRHPLLTRCLYHETFRYGPCPVNSDSAVNVLLDIVRDQSGKQYKMDHYATRYPTNTTDIASFLVRLSGTLPQNYVPLLWCLSCFPGSQLSRNPPPLYYTTLQKSPSRSMKCALSSPAYLVSHIHISFPMPNHLKMAALLDPEIVIYIQGRRSSLELKGDLGCRCSKNGGRSV
jgi:hypothetical protein